MTSIDVSREANNILPEGWRWARLRDVCEEQTGNRDPRLEPDKPFHYVDISSIDNVLKRIIEAQSITGSIAPSRARQVMHKDDVLVATTRPNLNAVAMVPTELDGEICSTGFCVLRAKENLIPDYLFAFVRHETFIYALSELVKGALYPAVTDNHVKSQRIPLPPTLADQKRIATILNDQMAAVEKARLAAEARLAAARALPAAIIQTAFNNNIGSYPKGQLGKCVTKIGSGITPSGGQSVYQKSGIPLIRSQNVHLNQFVREGLAYISKEMDVEMEGSRVYPGDVLLNITGASIGRVCVVPSAMCPANVNQHVSIIRCTTELVPDFLSFYLSTPQFQKLIMNSQAGATRQALTKLIIENFEIPIPPLDKQLHLVEMLNKQLEFTDTIIHKLENELMTIGSLPAAIMRLAFTGGI